MKESVEERYLAFIAEKISHSAEPILFPPPVYTSMQGKLLEFDVKEGRLKNRFPILKEQLNPFGNMQGGMITAAMDNTVGPLSILIGPPSFTRYMDIKYCKVIPLSLENIYVTATFTHQKKRQLFFSVSVCNEAGDELASAKSTHWII